MMYVTLLGIRYSFRQSAKRNGEKRIAKVEEKLAEAEDQAKKNPQSSKPIWEMSYYQRERFIEINIKQNNDIFRLAFRMIVFGLILIILGLSRDFMYPSTDPNVAWAAVIAGLITQFIAATILVIFKLVFQQTMEYFKTVERMASIGVAMTMMDTLSDEERTK
jgi:hypothetical protein